jgi:hypothetical protein
MYIFFLHLLISNHQMVDKKVQEAYAHENLIEMYPQCVSVPPTPV